MKQNKVTIKEVLDEFTAREGYILPSVGGDDLFDNALAEEIRRFVDKKTGGVWDDWSFLDGLEHDYTPNI